MSDDDGFPLTDDGRKAQKMVRTGTLKREANVHEKRLEQAQKTVKTGPCTLKLSIKGVALANKDGRGGMSDPYLKLLTLPASDLGIYQTAHQLKDEEFSKMKEMYTVELKKTEVINNNANPEWKEFEVDMDKLIACFPDDGITQGLAPGQFNRAHCSYIYFDTKFMIECWDKDTVTKDDEIGWIVTTVRQLCTMQPLVLRDRVGGGSDKPGSLEITGIQIEPKPAV